MHWSSVNVFMNTVLPFLNNVLSIAAEAAGAAGAGVAGADGAGADGAGGAGADGAAEAAWSRRSCWGRWTGWNVRRT